ncbi:MAG: hypothetical protein LBM66_06530, partial [Bifidobacteriaceae bacterium]|nr:hypothetical protein [Bifidobacteriaceae bacterium]
MRSSSTKRRLAGTIAACAAAGAMALVGTAPLLASADPGSGPVATQWAWLNTSLAPQQRAALLVSELTLPEKIKQLGNSTPAVKRGDDTILPAYSYWNEALHGVVTGGSTMFSSPTGIGSTWNRSLVNEVGTVIGDEARA